MQFVLHHKWATGFVILFIVFLGIIVSQYLFIRYNGTAVSVPDIPRTTERFGTKGQLIKYVVMGDSTSVAQGTEYSKGIARHTALFLAKTHQVELTNVGVSGARISDVITSQLAKAVSLHPDVVLIAISANDVTHFTNTSVVQVGTKTILTSLVSANPNCKIVLTGSPAMGSVPRFGKPTQWLAALRTNQTNSAIQRAVSSLNLPSHLVLVPLASQTAAIFLKHPDYFAQDNFHPNATGYMVWFPILDHGFQDLNL